VCSFQGLRFDSPRCQFRWASPYKDLLRFRTGPPQVDLGIGPLGLVGPWIGYRIFEKTRSFRHNYYTWVCL